MEGCAGGFVALQGRRNNAIISPRRTAGGKGSVQAPGGADRAGPARTSHDIDDMRVGLHGRASQDICD
jgi:hypothetical protein